MENLLKGIIFYVILLSLIGLSACSDSTPSNNKSTNTDTPTEETSITNALSAPIPVGNCDRPDEVIITNAVYQSAGSYSLTYSWTSVPNAISYEFELRINGNVAFQNLTLTDTFITFSSSMAATDQIKAAVKTVCASGKSTTYKESSAYTYMNAVATDEIIFMVDPANSVNDICSNNCGKIKFQGSSLKNSDGTDITLTKADMQVYFYDFNAVKACIDCDAPGGTPVVDPVAFNNCLDNPLTNHWIYDPGKFVNCK